MPDNEKIRQLYEEAFYLSLKRKGKKVKREQVHMELVDF